jgi:predicted dienelactone hydrolase
MSRHRILSGLAAVACSAVVATACSSQAAAPVDPAQAAADAAATEFVAAASPGPWSVGLRTVEVTDPADADRVFAVDVWYPVDPAGSEDLVPAQYAFIPGLGYTSQVSFADAPPADGTFPLVVYSHGSGGFRWVATFFTEFLATQGFVVAAPDHAGNTALDTLTGAGTDPGTTAYNRPRDVTATIDAVLGLSDNPVDPLAGRIDPDAIAVTGHSFGGFATLASVSGFTSDLGAVAADERVRAVVAMAPFTVLLSDDDLVGVDVPTLLLSATGDTTTPIGTNTVRPWNLISGRPLLRVDVVDAVHNSFTDLCQLQVAVAQIPDVPEVIVSELERRSGEACSDTVLDHRQVQRITAAYATAFLATELTGAGAYANVLACVGPPPEVTCEVKP